MLTSHAPVHLPDTLAQALAMRADYPEAMAIAGGTDLMVYLECGAINPNAFIDLWGLRELASIRQNDDGGISIGALATHRQIVTNDLVKAAAPTLVEAAGTVGARQIQSRGTLAGNIANASPAGDTLPVLLTLDAVVQLESRDRGIRRVPFRSLYTGYRTLDIFSRNLVGPPPFIIF